MAPVAESYSARAAMTLASGLTAGSIGPVASPTRTSAEAVAARPSARRVQARIDGTRSLRARFIGRGVQPWRLMTRVDLAVRPPAVAVKASFDFFLAFAVSCTFAETV